MQQTRILSSRGYSLVETVSATLLSLVLLMGAGALFRPALDISRLLTQRAVTQHSARVALKLIARELGMVGIGIPGGGIQLPGGTASQPKFACDGAGCYVTANTFVGNRLYALTPGDGKGVTFNGIATDVITFAYQDPNSNLDQYPLQQLQNTGVGAWFNPATSPAWNDPSVGAKLGDVLLVCSINGCASGVVTGLYADHLDFDDNTQDPLDFNQPLAPYGNIASIYDAAASTRVYRIFVVTYFIDNSDPSVPRLMRQVNASPPRVIAFNIENLQFSYDIFDENSSTVTTNLPDAGGKPNQIRKINISITSRAPEEGLFERGYERVTLTTSLSTRNLQFRDSY